MLTLTKCFDHEGEAQECHEHGIELVEAAEDAAKALEPAEQPLDLVSAAVPGLAVRPGCDPSRERRNDWGEAEIEGELAGFIAFICSIHDDAATRRQLWQGPQQVAAGWGIAGLPSCQGERDGGPSIRGNHMNFGGPSGSGLADGLGAVFFRAPVPSGCTLTIVLSRLTDSILMRMNC